tara:strand:+ start:44123 stop:44818 length:696 start_codon:yes stop_codon:yes gene_type:complete
MAALLPPLIFGPGLHAATDCGNACDDETKSPRQLIIDTTADVLTIAKSAQGYFDQDPERYYREIEKMVDILVDTERFTRGVMATYASALRYRALASEAEKALFSARIKRFSEILKHTLVVTYAQALLNADGQRIETLPPGDEPIDSGYARVDQKIYGPTGVPHDVQYSLRRNPGEPWKLYNVIIDGINIGHIFRNQFAYSVEKYKGNVDLAIDNWSSEQHSEAVTRDMQAL